MFGLAAANRCCSLPAYVPRLLARSTSSPTRLCSTASSTSRDQPSAPTERMMPFPDYIKYKKRLRSRQLMWALPCGMSGMVSTAMIVSSRVPSLAAPAEEIEPIMGMDPLVFYGGLGTVNGFIVAVIGHWLFGQLWHLTNAELSSKLLERDNDFKLRIAKHRFEGDSRFEDDYYGDKIKNLSDYRQWIRTQMQKKADFESHQRQVAQDNE